MIAGHGSFLGCFIERKVPDIFISQYRTRVDTYQSVFFLKKFGSWAGNSKKNRAGPPPSTLGWVCK
jgi:hypothetical protein